jgi:hypothetical protein
MKWIIGISLILFLGVGFANDPISSFQPLDKKIELNRRVKYPAGFNLYAMGPIGIGGISFDYFIVPKIALEIGAGARTFDSDYGFLAGGRYHFFGNTLVNTTFYLGVYSGFEYINESLRNYNLYIPFGLQRIKKNRLAWSIEIAYKRDDYDLGNNLYGGGKLGIRF